MKKRYKKWRAEGIKINVCLLLFATYIFSYGCINREEHLDDLEKGLDNLLERMDESRGLIDEQKNMMREVKEPQKILDSNNVHDIFTVVNYNVS